MSYHPIWISEATNFKNNALGLRGAQNIIEVALPKSGLSNKHARLYIVRHSGATHLAKHLTEAQMCTFFGWVWVHKLLGVMYICLENMYSVLFALNEGGQMNMEEHKLKSVKCKRCSESISPTMHFCSGCALPVNLNNEYTSEMDLERQNRELNEKFEQRLNMIRTEMNKRLSQIISMIRQSPKLAYAKPQALLSKI